ncbi:hypothetical protein PMR92_09680, partial [Bifidobacterium longum]|uniref:hypothetical protein n=1 Tax=Bifidobacterium longum TaxID=216816 RepID=UPI001E3481F8
NMRTPIRTPKRPTFRPHPPLHNAALTFDYRCHSDRYYQQSSSQQQAGNRHRSSAGGNRQHSRRHALITLAAKIREADHGYAIAINRINNRTCRRLQR